MALAASTIYHGRTISSAKMIGVTTDPGTVALVARRILEESRVGTNDAVLSALEAGRRMALKRIIDLAES